VDTVLRSMSLFLEQSKRAITVKDVAATTGKQVFLSV
jgi:hypothetical protein